MRKCKHCGLEKDESEFYNNKRIKDGLDYYCKECRRLKQSYVPKEKSIIKTDNKTFIDSLKAPCEKCGEDRPWVIQFHHVDPYNKSFMISASGTRSKQTILKEVSKCVCLCSNCHDEFHHFYGKVPAKPVDALLEYLK